jgi:spore coat protein JC
MWIYEKKLQYPVNIKKPDARAAKVVMTQLGGPDGEAGAAMRYLHQRFSCPFHKITGVLTDIGTEEAKIGTAPAFCTA